MDYNDFDLLYKDTYNDILKYVICKCSKIDDIEDIMQNIYISAYNMINKNKSINILYLMGIAKNKVNDYYRFKFKDKLFLFKKNDDLELLDNIPSNINIEESINKKYDVDLVWSYLKNKNIIIFKVFYLYYHDNMKIKDIANTLDINESNVKHYLYRTLKELNSFLESGV